jgi:hypothetical protein
MLYIRRLETIVAILVNLLRFYLLWKPRYDADTDVENSGVALLSAGRHLFQNLLIAGPTCILVCTVTVSTKQGSVLSSCLKLVNGHPS